MSSTNHNDIGSLYIFFSVMSSIIGLTLSFIIRVELSEPGSKLLINHLHTYNVIVTTHALIMIFFVVMPIMLGGFTNWFLPILLGCSDMSFPSLNNLAFWLLPSAFFLLLLSGFIGSGCGTGWTIYKLDWSSTYIGKLLYLLNSLWLL